MKKKKVIHYIIAFILPVLLLFIIAMLSNHVPFGEYLFNYSDAYSMYPAILTHSIRTILDGHFFYNIYSALGSDFYNLRTLYMNSPFHLLFFLFKKENIFVFYTILLFLKVGLSSYTMCIYLNHISKDKYTWKQILFSLTYALSSFGVACSVHIMWTDSVILLPLIILGLDKLIEENKSGFYILYLTLAILVNFYIGYMLCIFCLIYFLYKAYVREKLQVETCKHFIFSSLLCGMMSSIVLIPQIISLIAGRGSHFSFSTLKGISIFSLFSIPSSLLSGMYSSFDNFSNGSPLLYCSLFVLVMNIFYFFNNIFILGGILTKQEIDQKMKWFTINYPKLKPENVFFIAPTLEKFEVLEEFCKHTGTKPKDVVLIDDDLNNLRLAEKHGFMAYHVTSLVD